MILHKILGSYNNMVAAYSHMRLFAEHGNETADSSPGTLEFLANHGYIRLQPVIVNSITAMMKGRPESFSTFVYMWTPQGSKAYDFYSKIFGFFGRR